MNFPCCWGFGSRMKRYPIWFTSTHLRLKYSTQEMWQSSALPQEKIKGAWLHFTVHLDLSRLSWQTFAIPSLWRRSFDIHKLKVLFIVDKLVWWTTQLKLKVDQRKKNMTETSVVTAVWTGSGTESESGREWVQPNIWTWRCLSVGKGNFADIATDRQIDILSHPAWHSRSGVDTVTGADGRSTAGDRV